MSNQDKSDVFHVRDESGKSRKRSGGGQRRRARTLEEDSPENDNDAVETLQTVTQNDESEVDQAGDRFKFRKQKRSPTIPTRGKGLLSASAISNFGLKRKGKFKKRNDSKSSPKEKGRQLMFRNKEQVDVDENDDDPDAESTKMDDSSRSEGDENESIANEPFEKEKTTLSALFSQDDNDKTFLLERDLKNGNIFNITTYQRPTQKSQEEIDALDKIIFVPSTDPVPLDEKISVHKTPRYPEDEGLYHGEVIPLSTKNQNRLEQRILKEHGMAWFGQDGEIESFPDPRRQYGVRIFYDEDDEERFQRKLTFVPAKLDPFQMFQLDSASDYELMVDIASITFAHHPLFSKEHILAAKLESRFEEYSKRQELGTTERIKNKLKALREVLHYTNTVQAGLKDKCNGEFSALPPEEQKQFSQNEERLKGIRRDMKKGRLERDQSLWDDRVILISVLDIWKSLKALRQHQDYTSTPIKLNILTHSEDLTSDREKWVSELNMEFEDIKEEFKADHEVKTRKYQEQLKMWERQKRHGKLHERGDEAEEGQEYDSAADEREGAVIEKPRAPEEFDSKKVREEISKRFRQLNRLPGEPKIVLELLNNPITLTSELPKGSETEVNRRSFVESSQIKIRVSFNGREVYRSGRRELKSDFTTFFGLTIPIAINEWPKSLTISIWEYGKLGKLCHGEIKLNLPNSQTSIGKCQSEKFDFKSNGQIKVNSNAGVGSGVSFEILGKERQGLSTCGFGLVRVGWSQDEQGNLMCPKMVDHALGDFEFHKSSAAKKRGQFGKLSEESQIDPNDPSNARWLSMQVEQKNADFQRKMSKHRELPSKADKFALDELMEEFDFCTMEELNSFLRFKLLSLRDENNPEFKNYRMVPPFEEDIPPNIFKTNEKQRLEVFQEETAFEEIGRLGSAGGGSHHFINRLDKIKQIRESIMQLFEKSSKQLTFEDLVIEEQIPDIGTLGLNLMSLFQPRRALRPERKERKKVTIGTSLIDTSVTLVVNIVRATNLPMKRMESTNPQILSTEAITGVSLFKKDVVAGVLSPVKPFVEVSFKRNIVRSITSVGTNPIWNQELQLLIPSASSSNLNQIDDNIYVLIYDEVEIDILEDDRRRGTDIHQRFEKRWLGSVTIPFSTLYLNGRIEGTFKINSPSILLGYEYQLSGSSTNFGPQTRPHDTIAMGNQLNQAFITFFITFQPSMAQAIISKAGTTGEASDVLSHIHVWEEKMHSKHPSRKLLTLVMNSSGESLLATRYLVELAPPETLLRGGNEDTPLIETMYTLAHFVALFPTIRSTVEITDMSLWLTSDVFVGTPGGGVDEQAILLTCFFMDLEIPCWLLFGNAVLHGPVIFVLTSFKNVKKDDEKFKSLKNEVLIWNPSNGDCYNVNGSFCPLQNVWCIIGKSNIWGNVSPFESPQNVDWNFEKSSQWIPLFSKPIPETKLPSVQPMELIRYEKVDKTQVSRLTQYIERNLKEVFMIWRKTSKTIWNRHCSAILRRILPKLEQRKIGKLGPMEILSGTESNTNLLYPSELDLITDDESVTELKELMSTYQMTGFPLHQHYVNMESITEAVYATSLHSMDSPNIEFALAIYVKGYPANLFSIWIYLAALIRRK